MTWGRVAGWLTGLMLASLLLPAAASARIFSVMPANSAEEPADSFSDTDALFAIGTVDAFAQPVAAH